MKRAYQLDCFSRWCGDCKHFRREWPAAAAGQCYRPGIRSDQYCPHCLADNGKTALELELICRRCGRSFTSRPVGLRSERSDVCEAFEPVTSSVVGSDRGDGGTATREGQPATVTERSPG